MWRVRSFLLRLYHTVRPHPADAELQREIAAHLRSIEDALIESGAQPQAARIAARRHFGNIEHTKEQHRDARSFRWLRDAGRDIQHAGRALGATPVASLVAVLSLALGLGALVGVYSTADWLLNRNPGQVIDPDWVVILNTRDSHAPTRRGYFFSYAQFLVVKESQRSFASVAAMAKLAGVASINEDSAQVVQELVTGDFFPLLGVRPALGRVISSADEVAASPIPVVLSDGFWRSRFGGDRGVLGRPLRVNGQSAEVVGVLPAPFESIRIDWNGPTDVWMPLSAATAIGARLLTTNTDQPFLPILGRLRAGVSVDAAAQELQAMLPFLPAHKRIDTYQPTDLRTIPLRQMRILSRGSGQFFFTPLIAVCAMVLLAACFNLAEFVVGRVHARQVELAVRAALGASRGRLARQLVIESSAVALLAIAIALPVGAAVVGALSAASHLYLGLPTMVRAVETTAAFDLQAFARLAGLAVLCTMVFGVVPGLVPILREPSRHLHARPRVRPRWLWNVTTRQAFLAAEVALAVALSLVAALYALSFYHVSRVDPGYGDPGHVLLARLNTSALKEAERPALYRQLLDRLEQDPAVVGATVGWNRPFFVGQNQVWRPGQETSGVTAAITAGARRFFSVQQVRLLAGREFDDSDHDRSSAVLINAPLARALWPGRASYPIGETIDGRLNSGPRTVVGVVADDRCADVLEASQPCLWLPFPYSGGLSYLRIRTRSAPSAFVVPLREYVRRLNPDAAAAEEAPLDAYLASITAQHRAAMLASAGLAAFAVVLVAAGLATVFTSLVRQQQRDLALRLALGASPSRLRAQILASGAIVASVGAACGTVVGWKISALVAPQLYSVTVVDTRLLLVPLALVALSLAAVGRAAHEASRISPALPLKAAAVG